LARLTVLLLHTVPCSAATVALLLVLLPLLRHDVLPSLLLLLPPPLTLQFPAPGRTIASYGL
jgi:hypothetical protein